MLNKRTLPQAPQLTKPIENFRSKRFDAPKKAKSNHIIPNILALETFLGSKESPCKSPINIQEFFPKVTSSVSSATQKDCKGSYQRDKTVSPVGITRDNTFHMEGKSQDKSNSLGGNSQESSYSNMSKYTRRYQTHEEKNSPNTDILQETEDSLSELEELKGNDEGEVEAETFSLINTLVRFGALEDHVSEDAEAKESFSFGGDMFYGNVTPGKEGHSRIIIESPISCLNYADEQEESFLEDYEKEIEEVVANIIENIKKKPNSERKMYAKSLVEWLKEYNQNVYVFSRERDQ